MFIFKKKMSKNISDTLKHSQNQMHFITKDQEKILSGRRCAYKNWC